MDEEKISQWLMEGINSLSARFTADLSGTCHYVTHVTRRGSRARMIIALPESVEGRSPSLREIALTEVIRLRQDGVPVFVGIGTEVTSIGYLRMSGERAVSAIRNATEENAVCVYNVHKAPSTEASYTPYTTKRLYDLRFNSVNTFYKAFKRGYGVSPGQWRDNARVAGGSRNKQQ